MLSKLFTITCAVFATLAVSATCETQVEVREVAGSLSFLVHSLELNKKMEYCVLTPHDNTNSELIVIDTEHSPEMLAQCEQGAEGLFTIAQSGTSSKKMDKSGCDSRFASLCVPAAYEVVQSQMFQFSDGKKHNKAAADKVAGARSALIIQMDYLDKTPDCPMSCLQQSMWGSTYNVDGLYNEASYGNLRFSQSASVVVQLKMSSRVSDYDYCSNGPQKIRTDALAALSTQYPSIVPGDYNHMIMSSPALCGVAVSQVGGTLVWMNSNAQDVLGHELGHNLGRRHASLDTSDDDPSTQSSYSTDQDYGDLSCVMGYSGVGLRSFTVPARFALGWIPSSSIAVPPATCSNTAVQYTLASGQLPADNSYGYHAVQIPRAKGGKYYVSFRAGAGYDVNAPTGWKNAVFVHYVVATSTRTKFVAALTAGQSYSDSMTGFRVTVVGTGSNSATVSIVCGATVGNCDMKLVSGLSSIAGQFARSSSTINGTSAWARSDLRAVIAYCGTKSLWVVGTHDGSAVTNFSPCSSIMYKSSSSSQTSPTDSDTWYTCSSSSCSTDSSAALTVTSCTQVAVVANPSSSPSPSPSPSSSSSRSRSFSSSPSTSPSPVAVASSSSSPSRTSSASTSRSPSASVTPSASITPSSATSSSSSPSPSPSPSTSSSTSATPNTSSNSSPTRTATASVSTSASASKSRTPSTSFSRSSTSSVSSSKSTSATKSATKSRSASPSSSRSSSASRSGSVSSSASASSSRAPPAAKSMVENLAVITALDASTTPVCPYFESLCDKCAEVPSAICVYLTDLCLKCT